jgi:hypothetical protein
MDATYKQIKLRLSNIFPDFAILLWRYY